MRHSSLLLRGRTPPPPRLTLSVPAGSAQRMTARAISHELQRRSSMRETAKMLAVSTLASFSASFDPTQHAATDLTVVPMGRTAEAMLVFGLPHHANAAIGNAIRSNSKRASLQLAISRAFSAPLCISARHGSDDARTADLFEADRSGMEDEEEVQTSFGSERSNVPGQAHTTAGTSAIYRARDSSNSGTEHRSQRQQQQGKHTSSAELLGHRADLRRSGRHSSGPHTSPAAPHSAEESRAMLAARLMRRYRLHTSQPYIAISSGVEVPGCSGGAYHLLERQDARTSPSTIHGVGGSVGKANAYSGRVRSGGNNVRIPAFPPQLISSSGNRGGSTAAAATAVLSAPQVLCHDAAFTRMQDYEPFERLFRRYIERGHVVHVAQRLLHHPDGPAPIVLLDRILQHRVPSPSLVAQALLASIHAARADRSTSAAATFALERVAARLKTDVTCRLLYDTPDIRALLLEATLHDGLFEVAIGLVHDTPDSWITPHAWVLLVQAAGQSKLPHSQLLWRLLSIREGGTTTEQLQHTMTAWSSSSMPQRVLTRAGESALLKRIPLCPPYKTTAAGAAPLNPLPPSSPSAPMTSENGKSTTITASASSHLCTASSTPHSTAPSSELLLDAVPIPSSAFEARACSTVHMVTYASIGIPFLSSTAAAKAEEGDKDQENGSTNTSTSSAHFHPTASSATVSALVPSTFSTEGVRWCVLGPVDMGYAAEHYNGDTARAAGDFRAAGAAGVLHGFGSFQSLLADIEAEVRRTAATAKSNLSASSAFAARGARRALWETTALRMIHHNRGIVYGLDATTTARVLLRCGVGFSGQASPLLALHVLRRYLRSCHLLRDEIVQAQTLIEAQLDAEEGVLQSKEEKTDEASTTANDNSDKNRDDNNSNNKSSTTTSAVTAVTPRPFAEALLKLYPRLARAVAPHPSPFLVFFKVMREAREVLSNALEEENVTGAGSSSPTAAAAHMRAGLRANTSLPMVHWELVWHVFQQLNRENPQWFTQMTLQEAGDLCQDVIEVLCHGADPWLTLNISRRVSIRHIVDGVDMSLWLLHRLDPSHHTEEARDVARKLFRWLLVDVGLHLQPSLHHHLIPAARALIRLNLQDELRVLYSAVLDNVYLFSPEHRDAFVQVLGDLICPSCASILPESDVYIDRACPNCMTVVPAKDADTIPSFRLSAEHVERLRARRKQQRQRSRQRLTASVERLQSQEHNGDGSAISRYNQQHHQLLRGPQDAADVLRRHLQRSKDEDDNSSDDDDSGNSAAMALLLSDAATLVPGVSVTSNYALFPLGGASNNGCENGTTPVLDVRAAMEESSRRLELQRAARRYALAQRGELEYEDSSCTSMSSLNSHVSSRRTAAAMPTTLPISAQALDAATLKYLSTATNMSVHASLAKETSGAGTITIAHDGAWVCVWCQEKNSEWSSRVQCGACGAETGPSAPWRHFAYADPIVGDVMTELRGRMSNCAERPVDAIVAGYMLMVYRRTFQLRATPADQERLQQLVAMLCRLQERVLAGYVYTRLVPLTRRHLGGVLELLAQVYGQENEPRYRALTQDDVSRPEKEAVFFDAVFGPQTCRVCFGNHDWHVCPIVTRDFADGAGGDAAQQQRERSPISLSPEEKQRSVLERLANRIQQAARSSTVAPASTSTSTSTAASAQVTCKPNAQLVVDAYTAFVSSPFRETFAELHAEDTNQLSLLLSRIQQYRRAAFVLCHIPLSKRSTEAYLKLVHFFNVTEEEALTLLGKKATSEKDATAAVTAETTTALNFVQVTKTCCMCLDQRHASHECPRLEEWLKGVQRLAKGREAAAAVAVASSPSKTTDALVDSVGEARLRQRLRAQVDGWTTAGPERLHTFYRYLETHMELLRPSAAHLYSASPTLAAGEYDSESSSGIETAAAERVNDTPFRVDFNDPLVYAVNKTVTKLATLARRSEAYRLYAHSPIECVSTATTAAMLRMNGFAEDSIRALLMGSGASASSSATTMDEELMTARSSSSVTALSAVRQHAPLAARTASVPVQRCCLLCFSASHAYVDCPELAAAATESDKLSLILKQVGGISCVSDGIGAAAAYTYSEYNRGRLSSEMMRSNPPLVQALLTLARRCFATRQLSHGVRVLRRIPVEMLPPATAYADLWRAAGLPEEEVEQKQSQLLALFDAEGLVPCVDPPPPRPTYSNKFLSQLSRILHDGLCRHCFEHGHTIATCPLFHSEVSFGRDYVAAYRMSMMSEQLDRAWQEAYLLKLVDFFSTHYLFMPYHIAGVANALNAITAMWSFRGEPGIALRNLLMIPPAYRRRQSFKHILHCLRVPPADITRLLGDFYFAPDNTGGYGGSNNSSGGNLQQQQEVMMAQHLLIPKPAIRDLARRQIFERVPAAMVALEESTERMAQIRANHERRGGAADLSSPLGKAAVDPTGSGNSSDGSISAHIEQFTTASQQQQRRHQQLSAVANGADGVAASSFNSPILRRIMQSGDMPQLREDFDPILAELEDAVGMRLGSRHTLFTSAMDILGAAAATVSPSSPSSSVGVERRTRATVTVPNTQQLSKEAPRAANAESSTAASASRNVPDAEVVREVQKQPVKPTTSLNPTISSFVPRHKRGAPQQQQQHMTRDTQSARKQTMAASQSSPSSSTPAGSKSGTKGIERALPRAAEDEVQSSFPTPSASPSMPQQQQQRTAVNSGNSSGNNNRNHPYSHNNSKSKADRGQRGNRSNSHRSYDYSRQSNPQQWQGRTN